MVTKRGSGICVGLLRILTAKCNQVTKKKPRQIILFDVKIILNHVAPELSVI